MRIMLHHNELVHALLTDQGEKVWRKFCKDRGINIPIIKVFDIKITLGNLMEAFGPHINGECQMFVNGHITIGEPEIPRL